MKSEGNTFNLVIDYSVGLVAINLLYTKPFSPTYFWELAYDKIVRGDCILNYNTDRLKAAQPHGIR